jgi:ubiquinone/menaquinone biosynthesis C-methylase UbiE
MSLTQPQVYAAPFDAVAERYDQTFTSSKIGQAQRSSVWKELEKAFRSGDRVLEIGCGTGVDACFLADRGVQVVACDNSPRMIAVATQRLRESKRASLVQPTLLAAEEIAILRGRERFDGAFSNFGALNCVQDPGAVARNLAGLLRPGAKLLLCWMGRCCLWEMVWYLAQAKPEKAFRRFRRGGATARFADGSPLRVYYPSLRSLARAFAPEFRLTSCKGVGIFVPPSYLEVWAARFPRLLRLGTQADSLLARCPGIRVAGDHLLLEFERE